MHKIKAYGCKIIEGYNRIEIDVYGKHYIYFYIDNSDQYPGLIMESNLLQKTHEISCFYKETDCKLYVENHYNLNGNSNPVIFCNYTPICLITEAGIYVSRYYIRPDGLCVELD